MRYLDDAEFRKIIETQPWFRELVRAQCDSQLVQLGEHQHELARRLIQALHDAQSCERRLAALQARRDRPPAPKAFLQLRGDAQRCLDGAEDAFLRFKRGPHRYLMPSDASMEFCDECARGALRGLAGHLENGLVKDLEACRRSLQNTIDTCTEQAQKGTHDEV